MPTPVADNTKEQTVCPACMLAKALDLPWLCAHDIDDNVNQAESEPCMKDECVKAREERDKMNAEGEAVSKELIQTYTKLITTQLQLTLYKSVVESLKESAD